MKRNNKKGFTIVELVIVIAVIAILAAVLIPTFANLIDKANESVDVQAVRQMNTILQAEEATNRPDDINEMLKILEDNGISANQYKPLSNGNSYWWVASKNRVVLVNAQNKVIYPSELANLTYGEGNWMKLSNDYPMANLASLSQEELKVIDKNTSDEVNLDAAFILTAPETGDAAKNSKYKNYHVDFVIIPKGGNVPKKSVTIYGQQDMFGDKWFSIPAESDIAEGTEIRLLALANPDGAFTYLDMCEYIKEFKCGIAGTAGYETQLKGLTAYVELRLYEADESGNETGNYTVMTAFSHTF